MHFMYGLLAMLRTPESLSMAAASPPAPPLPRLSPSLRSWLATCPLDMLHTAVDSQLPVCLRVSAAHVHPRDVMPHAQPHIGAYATR